MQNNTLYLESYSTYDEYCKSSSVQLPVTSYISYCIFNFCVSRDISLRFVPAKYCEKKKEPYVSLKKNVFSHVQFVEEDNIPWQVNSCFYPVVICSDTIITGLCAVARHICKYRTSEQSSHEHREGLLGFRSSCLQAPNEVSIWTKFCEVDLLRTLKDLLSLEELIELPRNLVRFENHLKKPVRVHNVYKIARNLKKEQQIISKADNVKNLSDIQPADQIRLPKVRKWKSKAKKALEIDCSTKIEDLKIDHLFAEGPFLTLADLVLLPSYYIIIKSIGVQSFENLLPLSYKWFSNILQISELHSVLHIMDNIAIQSIKLKDVVVPITEDFSLYKCDPKRHNPKKRIFTKEEDIEDALSRLIEGMELNISANDVKLVIDWNNIPDGANPSAGHLPDERVVRKSQQLENLALAVTSIAKEGDLIVDFCSGSGHLGILVAHLLPKCTIILLENKEQSLLRARDRVHKMGLTNILFFQCNLDFFTGNFDVGVALHACGIASDLVLDKCLKANAKFVLCPCCYGSLHVTDRLVYPRSCRFSNVTIDQYLCIGHAADQTHEEHPLTARGAKCMAVIDSDRARLAEEFGYNVTLSRLKPLSCTPKNNLLIGIPA